jgi:hypothetical protein
MPWPMTLVWYSNTWRRSPSTRSPHLVARRLVLGVGLGLHCQQVRRHVGAQRVDVGLQLGPEFAHSSAEASKQLEN